MPRVLWEGRDRSDGAQEGSWRGETGWALEERRNEAFQLGHEGCMAGFMDGQRTCKAKRTSQRKCDGLTGLTRFEELKGSPSVD